MFILSFSQTVNSSIYRTEVNTSYFGYRMVSHMTVNVYCLRLLDSLRLPTVINLWYSRDRQGLLVSFFFRFLSTFLDECTRVLSSKLECTKKSAEENREKFDDSSKELEELEKTRKEVYNIFSELLVLILHFMWSFLHYLYTTHNDCVC